MFAGKGGKVQCRNHELQLMLRGEAQACSSTAAALVVESEPLDKHIYLQNTQVKQIIAVISSVHVET